MIFKTLKVFGEMFESAQNLYNLANMLIIKFCGKIIFLKKEIIFKKSKKKDGKICQKQPVWNSKT